MKLGRTFAGVREALRQSGRLSDARYVERATTGEQRVLPVADVDAAAVPYFSMIVVPGHDRRLDSAGRAASIAGAVSNDHRDSCQLFVVGIGPGPENWITPEASALLNEVDHAAWQGRRDVTKSDIRAAARLALPHRRRRNPFDAPGLDEDLLDQLLNEEPDPDPTSPEGGSPNGSSNTNSTNSGPRDMATQYYTASSIDGFIADSDNSLTWLFQFSEQTGMEDHYPKFIAQVGAMAMGSTTYEWVADHTGFLDDPSKWEYTIPTWVFSSRALPRVKGPDIRFVSGDVAPVHEEMVRVAEGRNVWLVGGGDLVGQFHDQGLLDEVLISFASVFLGSGAPLLPRRIVTPPMARSPGTIQVVRLPHRNFHPPALDEYFRLSELVCRP